MSRVFFTPQSGREGKSGVKKEDEWGTTSSKSEFRAYEPAEMRNARDAPRHVKELLKPNEGGTQPKSKRSAPLYTWHRLEEHYPDHSAVTGTEESLPRLSNSQGSKSSGNKPLNSRAAPPKWATSHLNPIPERSFDALSSYNHHQLEAHMARQSHFPYRDEFAPRSKRMLYEMALHRASQDSVASGSTATASAFTMSSRHSDRRSERSAARSQSEGSLVASSHHTADSERVIGGVAKRRAQAQYRAPSLWPADEKWFQEKWEKEGPNGLTCANFKPGYHQRSCKMQTEQWAAAPYRHPIKAPDPAK